MRIVYMTYHMQAWYSHCKISIARAYPSAADLKLWSKSPSRGAEAFHIASSTGKNWRKLR